MKVNVDGVEVGNVPLDAPLNIQAMQRGLAISTQLETISFGPLNGVVLDDLIMSK